MNATIPSTAGYLFAHNGRAFSPDGAVGSPSQTEVDQHNARLALAELEMLKASGRGVLYLTKDDSGAYKITQWSGSHICDVHPWRARTSWHNMADKDGRTDVWFNFDGSTWHGVNIGDNQILRVKRVKGGGK